MICRTRLEFSTKDDAKTAMENKGGWFFVSENGKTYWYSMDYTPTEILMDVNGSGKLGTFNQI